MIIEKELSPNDVGATGAHQGGMLIPKKQELMDFFPTLNPKEENPRVAIDFIDDLGITWTFNYIYYNNKFRGGTRNEYRLTGMTAFFRQNNASPGDQLFFELRKDDYYIRIKKPGVNYDYEEDGIVSLVLDNSWKIISY